MHWMKRFFLLLILPCVLSAAPHSLKEQLLQGTSGDFVVIQQEGHCTLLLIRSLDKNRLILEEIVVPSCQINLQKIDWQTWIFEKAPGHTSWALYEIDLQEGKLLEGFSFTQNGWLPCQASDHVLSRLLLLPLSPLPSSERKKIGASSSQEDDHRSVWHPPLFASGKKVKGAKSHAYQARWPIDDSQLSQVPFTFYFSDEKPKFPFPIWLEAETPYYTFKWRAVDLGSSLSSPLPENLPKRTPQIAFLEKGKSTWHLHVRSPSYFPSFHLFALDESSKMISIPCKRSAGKEGEAILEISVSDLKTHLAPSHFYQWMVVPESVEPLSALSLEKFRW